jgi:hypothetical protein
VLDHLNHRACLGFRLAAKRRTIQYRCAVHDPAQTSDAPAPRQRPWP